RFPGCFFVILIKFSNKPIADMSVPDEFLGTWTFDKHEGFDDLLASKNVPWVIRKVVIVAGETKKFTKLGEGKWEAEHQMATYKAKYEFTMGVEFVTRGMEGIDHKIIVTMRGSTLVETHQLLDKPNQPLEDHTYHIEGGKLVQTLRNGDIVAKRYFKRKN
ncbi:hypothetical protein PFISCL1PPCAC_21298, partial [Pristionchus fissidentatus]